MTIYKPSEKLELLRVFRGVYALKGQTVTLPALQAKLNCDYVTASTCWKYLTDLDVVPSSVGGELAFERFDSPLLKNLKAIVTSLPSDSREKEANLANALVVELEAAVNIPRFDFDEIKDENDPIDLDEVFDSDERDSENDDTDGDFDENQDDESQGGEDIVGDESQDGEDESQNQGEAESSDDGEGSGDVEDESGKYKSDADYLNERIRRALAGNQVNLKDRLYPYGGYLAHERDHKNISGTKRHLIQQKLVNIFVDIGGVGLQMTEDGLFKLKLKGFFVENDFPGKSGEVSEMFEECDGSLTIYVGLTEDEELYFSDHGAIMKYMDKYFDLESADVANSVYDVIKSFDVEITDKWNFVCTASEEKVLSGFWRLVKCLTTLTSMYVFFNDPSEHADDDKSDDDKDDFDVGALLDQSEEDDDASSGDADDNPEGGDAGADGGSSDD